MHENYTNQNSNEFIHYIARNRTFHFRITRAKERQKPDFDSEIRNFHGKILKLNHMIASCSNMSSVQAQSNHRINVETGASRNLSHNKEGKNGKNHISKSCESGQTIF